MTTPLIIRIRFVLMVMASALEPFARHPAGLSTGHTP